MLIISCLIILAGAVIMFLNIIRINEVMTMLPLVRKSSKGWLRDSVSAHRDLMFFFLAGYLIIIAALIENIQFISNLFIGILLCAVAIFIYIGIQIQNKMSQEIIRTMSEFIPICASCKKIRVEGAEPDNQSAWIGADMYFAEKSKMQFTHGFCPECMVKLFPKYAKKKAQR